MTGFHLIAPLKLFRLYPFYCVRAVSCLLISLFVANAICVRGTTFTTPKEEEALKATHK